MTFTTGTHPFIKSAKTLAVAAALACGAAGAMANSSASYEITGFSYSVSSGADITWLTGNNTQSVNTEAREAGGLLGNSIDSADDNSFTNHTYNASTANASATTKSTDSQRISGSASTSASLLGGPFGNPNFAQSILDQTGEFSLSAAGSVTFQVTYFLDAIAETGNGIDHYGQSSMSFTGGAYGQDPAGLFSDSLFSYDEGGYGLTSGTWFLTVALDSPEAVGFFNLHGTAEAFAPSSPLVAAVPEPSEWALMLLGLAAVGAWARKSRKQA
jgi:hypothetical protein